MKDPIITEARKMLVSYLKDQAHKKGYTTYRLAMLTGMDQPNIHRILTGKYSPNIETLLILCRALKCYIFIADKDDPGEPASIMRDRWKRTFDEQ